MKAGWTISAVLHAGVLAWGLIAFATRPLNAPPPEFLVDRHHLGGRLLADHARASRTAPKAEVPKPLVEKIAEAKPVENPTAKVVDEARDRADRRSGRSRQARAEQKKAEPKPPTPQPQKPEPKQAFAKEPEPKVDPIAEALKKDNQSPRRSRKRRPRRRRRRRRPSRRSRSRNSTPRASRRCSTSAIRSAAPRPAARLSNTPSLGTETGRAVTLSQNELDALRARLRQCWNVPVGLADARDLVVTVRIQFKQDGILLGRTARDRTARAIRPSRSRRKARCARFAAARRTVSFRWRNTKPGRTSIVDFDPRDMFRG